MECIEVYTIHSNTTKQVNFMYKSEVEAFVKTQIGENQYFTPLVIANTLYPTFSYVDKEIGLCSTLYEGILACLRDLELKEVVEGVFKKKTTLLQDMGFVEDSDRKSNV